MITVSPAEPGDVADIAALLEELGRFYGAGDPEPPGRRLDQVRSALFGTPPAGYALLARDGRRVPGLAAYSFLWPAVGATRVAVPEGAVRAGRVPGRGAGE